MFWVYEAGKKKNETIVYGLYSEKNALKMKKKNPNIIILDFKTGNFIDEKGHQIYRNKVSKVS